MMSKSLLLAHWKSSLSTDGAGNQPCHKYLIKRKKQTSSSSRKINLFYLHLSKFIVLHKKLLWFLWWLSLISRPLSVAMLTTKSIRFCLLLIFLASPHISSSTRVITTVSDGKVFITGDHNEVVMSSARETKVELAKIKNRLKLLSESNEDLCKLLHAIMRLTGLEKQGRISFLSWYR